MLIIFITTVLPIQTYVNVKDRNYITLSYVVRHVLSSNNSVTE